MAQLPPKIPNMSQSWPDFSSHQKINNMPLPPNDNIATNKNNHHHTNNPSWVDEFLDFSSSRRGAHRRSVSDSVTFLETTPNVDDNKHGDENEFDYKFDDEQFLSMFTDEISVVHMMPPTLSSSNPSSPSGQNFVNGEKEKETNKQVKNDNHEKEEDDEKKNNYNQQLKNEPDIDEVESQCNQETSQPQNNNNNPTSSNDRITDPKRVKRILANRQSAQRSRVRKLQYISELERSVTSLQAEVSVLSPRVAFFDHQRLLLNVDNSALKQRIAALAQDKLFKDAHQEALKREIERLRQVYNQQMRLKMMENNNNASGLPLQKQILCDSHSQPEKDHQLLNV